VSAKGHPLLLPLFKVCLRVRRRNPLWLISPLYGLRYHNPHDDALKPGLYSRAFSQLLTHLLVHPCMRRGVVRLAFTIQYAVVCRHDDGLLWLTHSIDNLSDPVITRPLRAFQRGGGSLAVSSRQYMACDTITQLYIQYKLFYPKSVTPMRYLDTTMHSSLTSVYILSLTV
jgi:hypothetical protein